MEQPLLSYPGPETVTLLMEEALRAFELMFERPPEERSVAVAYEPYEDE